MELCEVVVNASTGAGLVSMQWLSWAVDDSLTGHSKEPIGLLCFSVEQHAHQ